MGWNRLVNKAGLNMNHTISRVEELKKMIDTMTQNIAEKIPEKKLDDVDQLFSNRQSLIAELISLHSTEESREELINYLMTIRQRDHHNIQMIKEERDQVHSALLKIGKLKEYVGN